MWSAGAALLIALFRFIWQLVTRKPGPGKLQEEMDEKVANPPSPDAVDDKLRRGKF